LVLVNGHGGNYVLSNVVQEANVDGPAMTLFPGKEDWAEARAAADLETNADDDMHAGHAIAGRRQPAAHRRCPRPTTRTMQAVAGGLR